MTTIENDLPVQHCDQCGTAFRQKRKDQRFCAPKCQRAWHHHVAARAAQVYPMLYAHRKSHGKSVSMSEIWKIIDGHIAEDKKGKAA